MPGDLEIGDVVLGKYELAWSLGRGELSEVFAARVVGSDRLVVLKTPLPDERENPEIVARLAREARHTRRLRGHPHVARVVEVGYADGAPVLVMNHFGGEDLTTALERGERLPLPAIVDLFLQLCEAVHATHVAGLAHCAIRPRNIFIARRDHADPKIKLLNFGRAKDLYAATPGVDAEVEGLNSYASPEQWAGEAIDSRTDVWSLGVVLYAWLTRARPFDGATPEAVARAVTEGAYEAPSIRRPDVSMELERAIAAALTVDRASRIQSVALLARRVAPFGTSAARLSLAHIEQTGAHGRESFTRWSTRQKVAAGLAGFGLLVGLLGDGRGHLVGRRTPLAIIAEPPTPAGCEGMSSPDDCEAACARREPRACLRVAERLDVTGIFGPPEDREAADWLFEALCSEGDEVACDRFAYRVASRVGAGKAEFARATALFDASCDAGYAQACLHLAFWLKWAAWPDDGALLEREPYARACELGGASGCYDLSLALSERHQPTEAREAFEFAARACSLGLVEACIEVAIAKVRGQGVTADVRAGIVTLDTLCAADDDYACRGLAECFASGSEQLQADPDLAAFYEQLGNRHPLGEIARNIGQ